MPTAIARSERLVMKTQVSRTEFTLPRHEPRAHLHSQHCSHVPGAFRPTREPAQIVDLWTTIVCRASSWPISDPPSPPRVSWEEAEQRIAPMLLSFMSESRRLANDRMKRELRVRLRYPTPQHLLKAIAPRDLKKQLALPL